MGVDLRRPGQKADRGQFGVRQHAGHRAMMQT
jgi:hypothetical protein